LNSGVEFYNYRHLTSNASTTGIGTEIEEEEKNDFKAIFNLLQITTYCFM
jgi:hypothetical protein